MVKYNKERVLEMALGAIMYIASMLILTCSYVFLGSVIVTLILLLIFLPLLHHSIVLIMIPRERFLTLDKIKKRLLIIKRCRILALILGV
jgi:hypothetical protein